MDQYTIQLLTEKKQLLSLLKRADEALRSLNEDFGPFGDQGDAIYDKLIADIAAILKESEK